MLRESVRSLVIDEADHVLREAPAGAMRTLLNALPKAKQTFLMSATLDAAVEVRTRLRAPAHACAGCASFVFQCFACTARHTSLLMLLLPLLLLLLLLLQELKRALVVNRPAKLHLNEGDAATTLSQFFVRVPSGDKLLLLFSLLKLRLIAGKAIFFVNDIEMCAAAAAAAAADAPRAACRWGARCIVTRALPRVRGTCSCRCYRVKLFLELFTINAAVLNAELPLNSRLHILNQFNSVRALVTRARARDRVGTP